MSDLDNEIVALRVSGVSEPEICHRLGCTMGRVRAALDESAARALAPANVQRILIESLDTLGVLEQILAANGADQALVRQCRRRRARTAKLILERAPTSNPV